MRSNFNTALCTLALAASALAALPAGVLAATGGAAAPTAQATAKVHPKGIATWFGPGFYGHQTACGQTLTAAVVGVANRTLPCGTLVKVSYGGRTLVLPVLDRGPYGHIGAEWDLTSGAAEALGVTETVRIAARIVGIAPVTPTLGLPSPAPTSAVTGGSSAL